MNEELLTLCEVQKIDTEIIGNEKKRALAPQRIEEMEREVAQTKEKLAKRKGGHRRAGEGKKEERTGAGRGESADQEGGDEAPRSKNQQRVSGDAEGDGSSAGRERQDRGGYNCSHGKDRGAEEGLSVRTERTEQEGKRGAEEVKELEKEIKTVDGIVAKLKQERERLLTEREPGPQGAIQYPHRKKGRSRRRECQERDMSRVLHEYPASAFHRGDEEQRGSYLPELQQDPLLRRRRMKEWHIYIDGASLGNPGFAGAGMVAFDEDGHEMWRDSVHLGLMTNNMAEYEALVRALRKVGDPAGRPINRLHRFPTRGISSPWKIPHQERRAETLPRRSAPFDANASSMLR